MATPAAFEYHPAQTVDEAIGLLQRYGDEAKILAGGHSLLPAMKLRLSQPEHLIDIGRIGALSYIREEDGQVAIGALTTYTQVVRAELLHRHFALLPEGALEVGDQQVRTRGTIGGSLAHADPAADMPGIVLALKGELIVQGPDGRRSLSADDFFQGTFATALQLDEILIEIRLTLPPARTGSAYEKLPNTASHYALTGCAAVITVDQGGICRAASVAITGASLQATRAHTTEAILIGKNLDAASIADAASHAADDLEIVSDIHGSEGYRRQMTGVMARRTLGRALERAQA